MLMFDGFPFLKEKTYEDKITWVCRQKAALQWVFLNSSFIKLLTKFYKKLSVVKFEWRKTQSSISSHRTQISQLTSIRQFQFEDEPEIWKKKESNMDSIPSIERRKREKWIKNRKMIVMTEKLWIKQKTLNEICCIFKSFLKFFLEKINLSFMIFRCSFKFYLLNDRAGKNYAAVQRISVQKSSNVWW